MIWNDYIQTEADMQQNDEAKGGGGENSMWKSGKKLNLINKMGKNII